MEICTFVSLIKYSMNRCTHSDEFLDMIGDVSKVITKIVINVSYYQDFIFTYDIYVRKLLFSKVHFMRIFFTLR